MKTICLLAALTAVINAAPAAAQSAADSTAIKNTALDYIEGWWAGDAARMERSLHPELAKRNVATDPNNRRSRLIQMSALTLINQTRAGGGTDVSADRRRTDVRILDIYQLAASVRVDAGGWIDYMHMVKWNGQWRIVNVLWENAPRE